jgi:hypothetical protein
MFKRIILIKNCMIPFSFCLLFLSQSGFSKTTTIDILKGYVDGTFEITDINFNSHHGLDTIKFSNGLSLCTFYTGCCNAMNLCGTSGIKFLDATAIFYRSLDLNDTSWNKANAIPLPTGIGADTIRNCDTISHYPSYVLSHIVGEELPATFPEFKETPIDSKKILYGRSHERYLKFQLASYVLDTTHTAVNTTQISIKSIKIKFASDSAGNGKFLMKTTEIKSENHCLSISHQFRINKKLARSGWLLQKTNSIVFNSLGKNVVNSNSFPLQRFHR